MDHRCTCSWGRNSDGSEDGLCPFCEDQAHRERWGDPDFLAELHAGLPLQICAVVRERLRPVVDDVLTIRVTGPQGCGKTQWAEYIRQVPYDLPNPVVIEGPDHG